MSHPASLVNITGGVTTFTRMITRSSHLISCAWLRYSSTHPLPSSIPSTHPTTPSSTPFPNSKIQIHTTPSQLRLHRNALRASNQTVALVPTMGAFHAGHLALARAAAAEHDAVFVSIYVNPTQFGVTEDLAAYPRTFPSDLAALEALNDELASSSNSPNAKPKGHITAIFAPSTKTMYPTLPPTSEPTGNGSFVTITPLGTLLEGAARPVFFRGVATVCTKLFNIVQPDAVFFGQKDVQQTALIRRMVRDFHIPTAVRVMPTERESDGLAMSSRNVFLGARRRAAASAFPAMLQEAASRYPAHLDREAILQPARDFMAVAAAAQALLPPAQRARMELEYVSLADFETMEEVDVVDVGKGAVLSAALRMLPLEEVAEGEDQGEGGAGERMIRLIDNVVLAPLEGVERVERVEA